MITPTQIKHLHMLLNRTGMIQYKADMVHSYTAGRSQSSKDLTEVEAGAFISYLQSLDYEGPRC